MSQNQLKKTRFAPFCTTWSYGHHKHPITHAAAPCVQHRFVRRGARQNVSETHHHCTFVCRGKDAVACNLMQMCKNETNQQFLTRPGLNFFAKHHKRPPYAPSTPLNYTPFWRWVARAKIFGRPPPGSEHVPRYEPPCPKISTLTKLKNIIAPSGAMDITNTQSHPESCTGLFVGCWGNFRLELSPLGRSSVPRHAHIR